jgi:hypothetical protein
LQPNSRLPGLIECTSPVPMGLSKLFAHGGSQGQTISSPPCHRNLKCVRRSESI